MTNPVFHSWRLNWASLNPMFLLIHNRNKWGMAELCVCASLSRSHSYTEIQLQSFENFELSCKKLYDCLKFLRFNKHCMFLSICYLTSGFRTSWIIFPRFLGNSLYARWHSHKIPWFPGWQPPEHTVRHTAFITSCKSSFLSLILLFRCAPTYEREVNTKRIFVLLGSSPRHLRPKSTEGTPSF